MVTKRQLELVGPRADGKAPDQADPRTWVGAPGYPCPCDPSCPSRTPAASTPCLICGLGRCGHVGQRDAC